MRMQIPLPPRPAQVILCFVLFLGFLIFHNSSDLFTSFTGRFILTQKPSTNKATFIQSPNYPQPLQFPLNCTAARNQTFNYPTSFQPENLNRPTSTCPDYFRWIHEDLKPWKTTGIMEEMITSVSKKTVAFRLTIVNGRVYIKTFKKWYQSRAFLNIWGILQLLRRYPGKIPDLDLMFDCEDRPVVMKENQTVVPTPLFSYCADDHTDDIVFPDWSFWGWPELNIKPWDTLSKELPNANERIKWTDRKPYAYWKGNPYVSQARRDLFKCNVSKNHDWNARLYEQDWKKEVQTGFKDSDLTRECTHRYKLYVEGNAWSVSEKYILACDSVTLMVTPHYHDFFTRGLMPVQHYWPIDERSKCKSIKLAVDWGQRHPKQAQKIGKSSTKFVLENLKMDYVYDYMFHLLSEYAKLLKFKPKVPDDAKEYCSETMGCRAEGLRKKYMMETLEKGPALRNPCAMPPAYDSQSLQAMMRQKNDYLKKVGIWEKMITRKRVQK